MQAATKSRMLSSVNSLVEPSRPLTVSRTTPVRSQLPEQKSWKTSRNMPKQRVRPLSKIVSKLCRRLAKIDSKSRLRNEIPMRQNESSSPREMSTKNLAHLAKWSTTDNEYHTVRLAMGISIRISPSRSSELGIPPSPKHSTYLKSANTSTSSSAQIEYELRISGSRRQKPVKTSLSI